VPQLVREADGCLAGGGEDDDGGAGDGGVGGGPGRCVAHRVDALCVVPGEGVAVEVVGCFEQDLH